MVDNLRTVSGAIGVADMSVEAIEDVDYAKALDGLSLKQAQLMLTTQGIENMGIKADETMLNTLNVYKIKLKISVKNVYL